MGVGLDNELLESLLEHHLEGRSGSIRAECACGVVHFVSEGDFDEGELEDLIDRAQKEPKKYIQHCQVDYLSRAELGGRSYVLDCNCGWQIRYANFIWYNRRTIMGFLRAVTKELVKAAKENTALVNDVVEQSEIGPGSVIEYRDPSSTLLFRSEKERGNEWKGTVVSILNKGEQLLVLRESGNTLVVIEQTQVNKIIDKVSLFDMLTDSDKTRRVLAAHFTALDNK